AGRGRLLPDPLGARLGLPCPGDGAVAALRRQRVLSRGALARVLRALPRVRTALRADVLGDRQPDPRAERPRLRDLSALRDRHVRARAALDGPSRGSGGGLLLRVLALPLLDATARPSARRPVAAAHLALHRALARGGPRARRRVARCGAAAPGPVVLLPRLCSRHRVRHLSRAGALALAPEPRPTSAAGDRARRGRDSRRARRDG